MQQRRERALVTLAIGDDYVANFMTRTRPTWEAYCEKLGYDLILLTEVIDKAFDPAKKSVHWQKLLVGSLPQLRDYRQIAWLDGDVLINHRLAPCIFSEVADGRIGVVDSSDWFLQSDDTFNIHTRYLILSYFMKRQMGGTLPKGVKRPIITDGDLASYYRFLGLEGGATRMINTGVFAFSPREHGPFLAEVYAKYERDFMDFENTPLSYELQVSGLADYIDPRFNVLWSAVVARHYPFLFNPDSVPDHASLLELCANVTFRNSYFLHFAAGARNPIVKGAFETVDDTGDGVVAMVFPETWASREEVVELRDLATLDRSERGILF